MKLQHKCVPVNIAEFLRAPILKNICKRLLLPLEVFYKVFVDISFENAWFHILEDSYMAAAYVFLSYNWILVCEIYFRISGDNLNVS